MKNTVFNLGSNVVFFLSSLERQNHLNICEQTLSSFHRTSTDGCHLLLNGKSFLVELIQVKLFTRVYQHNYHVG